MSDARPKSWQNRYDVYAGCVGRLTRRQAAVLERALRREMIASGLLPDTRKRGAR